MYEIRTQSGRHLMAKCEAVQINTRKVRVKIIESEYLPVGEFFEYRFSDGKALGNAKGKLIFQNDTERS